MPRLVIAAIIVSCALLIGASAAHAVTLTGGAGEWMSTLRVHVAGPSGSPVLVEWATDCPGESAGVTTLYRDGSMDIHLCWGKDRYIALHELGHVFDERNLDSEERASLMPMLKAPGDWFECGSIDDYVGNCGAERFADAYAMCALGWSPDGRWATTYGWLPSPALQRRVCRVIGYFA